MPRGPRRPPLFECHCSDILGSCFRCDSEPGSDTGESASDFADQSPMSRIKLGRAMHADAVRFAARIPPLHNPSGPIQGLSEGQA